MIKTYVVSQIPKADRKAAAGSGAESEIVGEGDEQPATDSHDSEEEQINKRQNDMQK